MASKPLTGGYGCVDTRGFIGAAIRRLTHSNFSHAFVVLDADDGTILEAEPHGARIANLREYAGLELVFSQDDVGAQPELLKIVAKNKYVGIPYGFLDIVYLGLELQPIPIKPPWLFDAVLDERNMICSQMVAQFGESFGKDWRCGQVHAQLVTPGMLATRAQA